MIDDIEFTAKQMENIKKSLKIKSTSKEDYINISVFSKYFSISRLHLLFFFFNEF